MREVWIEWAEAQPNPKPSWLVPYDDDDDLGEADKEAERRIGSALWGEGFRAGVNFGLKQAKDLLREARPLLHHDGAHVSRDLAARIDAAIQAERNGKEDPEWRRLIDDYYPNPGMDQ